MARLSPALLALLGVVAYKNRDKLGQMLEQARTPLPDNSNDPSRAGSEGGLGGLLGGLGGLFGGASAGSGLRGGLGDLIESFTGSGHGDVAKSWVDKGPNQTVRPNQLEEAIGPEAMATLSQQTGLSREELLERLSQNLPEAVDKLTPQGRLPTDEEAEKLGKPTLLDGWAGGA